MKPRRIKVPEYTPLWVKHLKQALKSEDRVTREAAEQTVRYLKAHYGMARDTQRKEYFEVCAKLNLLGVVEGFLEDYPDKRGEF